MPVSLNSTVVVYVEFTIIFEEIVIAIHAAFYRVYDQQFASMLRLLSMKNHTALFLFAATLRLTAADLYVSPSGSDTNAGTISALSDSSDQT